VATYAISEVETGAASMGPSDRGASKATLVQRAQRGDPEAFGSLFQSHKNRVYSVCLSMTRNVAEAEDLTQDAFLQVFRSIRNFRGESAFSTWLHRIAVNTVLMKRRRRTPVTLSLDEPVSPDSRQPRQLGKSDPSLSGAIDRISLHRAIQSLPPGCRTIFGLHEVHGYQHQEIAVLLNCSPGNSKSQLHKAKKKMRSFLHPKWSSTRRRTALRIAGEKNAVTSISGQ
jgi:RNA polymerase sigma-70 factor (ECF subfamily)